MGTAVARAKIEHWANRAMPLNPAFTKMISVWLFSLMTALGAFISIPLPFTPVPLTLQTLWVLLSGACLGKGGGAASQILYILMGSVGFPIWSGGAMGLSRLWGPTGGYLLAFPLAAWTVGAIMEAGSHPTCRRALAAMGLGSLIIYALGLFQLSVWLHCTLRQGLILGILPFLPGDLIKIAAAVLICRKAGFVAFPNPTEIRE